MKRFVLVMGFFVSLAVPVLLTTGVAAALDPACDPQIVGQRAVESSPYCNTAPKNPANVIAQITRVLAIVGGIVAVIAVMLGGFFFVTSAGDPAKAAKGRSIVIYALIGLVIVVFAPLLVGYIVGRF